MLEFDPIIPSILNGTSPNSEAMLCGISTGPVLKAIRFVDFDQHLAFVKNRHLQDHSEKGAAR